VDLGAQPLLARDLVEKLAELSAFGLIELAHGSYWCAGRCGRPFELRVALCREAHGMRAPVLRARAPLHQAALLQRVEQQHEALRKGTEQVRQGPLTRFPGFVWLIAAGLELPRRATAA
jgi:hypothetical protein